MTTPVSLDFFCHVIDNFGDAGVCWRLVRQLKNEHGFHVTLWINHLGTLHRICAAVDSTKETQEVDGIQLRHWDTSSPVFTSDVADVVIEGFGCTLPADYIVAMTKKEVLPVWINLEYLSAETWVDNCHKMVSPQSATSLKKHFFFPGFTDKTGGLLREKGLLEKRSLFQKERKNVNLFFNKLGLNIPIDDCIISLFCYNNAPVEALFNCLQKNKKQPTFCIVPEGVASDQVSAFLKQPAIAGAKASQGALSVQVLPMIDQDHFDQLLWACDLNFIRGEDSFMRAQWAAKPFVWQIYPQEENAHHDKLDAFLEHYLPILSADDASIVKRLWTVWNGLEDSSGMDSSLWKTFASKLPELSTRGELWVQKLTAHEDLASNLVRFIHDLG